MDKKFKQRYEERVQTPVNDEKELLAMLPILLDKEDISTGIIVKKVTDDEGNQFVCPQITYGVIYEDWFICEDGIYPASFVNMKNFDPLRPSSIERIQKKIEIILSDIVAAPLFA